MILHVAKRIFGQELRAYRAVFFYIGIAKVVASIVVIGLIHLNTPCKKKDLTLK